MSGVVVWFTGLPASGKTTLAAAMRDRLRAMQVESCLLDSDEVRLTFVPAHDYSARGRTDFYETLGRLAALLARQGLVVLVAATANLRDYRDRARAQAPTFIEVHVATELAECRSRDPKRLYERADAGELSRLPGFDAPYEPPLAPELVATGGYDTAALDELEALLARAMNR